MKPAPFLIAAAVAVLASAGWLASREEARAAGFLPYDNPAAIAEGKKIYGEYCASCHGSGLEGEPDWRQRDADGYLPAPPHDLTGHTWHHPDRQLFLITKFGTEALVGNGYRSRMAGFGNLLGDQDIVNVLAYIKSTWPAPVIEQHNARNTQAAQD